MATLTQVSTGQVILASHHNEIYTLLHTDNTEDDATVTQHGLLAKLDKQLIAPQTATATGAMTADFSSGCTVSWTTSGNITGITLSNGQTNQWHAIVIKYGGVHTVAFTTAVKWPAAVTPTFTSVNGKYDVISLFYDGTNWLGSATVNF